MQQITGLELVQLEWEKDQNGRMQMKEVPGTEEILEADLVLLSMGFLHPVQDGIVNALKLKVNKQKNILTDSKFTTSHAKVFAAGDARNGASLVVTAIYSGREAAAAINDYLGTS
jgi:glutamate synthase (NADPH/NADH) small chain